jgi:hypothetical protein
MVQIRYLKAKFTRESSFRSVLVYQKQYLLVLLGMLERRSVFLTLHRPSSFTDSIPCSEKTVVAALARIGFPAQLPKPPAKYRSLKSVTLSIIFIIRAK